MKLAKKLSILLIILALLLPLRAQAITPVSFPFFHVTDPSTGMPEVGGLVWSYQAGTSSQSATYNNPDFAVGHANAFPIVLDSDGNCIIYINAPTKLVIEGPPPTGNTHGTVLFTIDNLEAAPYNSYITVGPTVPPTPGSNQLNLYCSGTTLYYVDSTGAVNSPATAQSIQQQTYSAAAGGGTGDAITASFTPAITSFVDKTRLWVWAPAANTTTVPTFSPNGLTAKTIVKGAGSPLVPGDIPGANAVILLEYNATLGDWVLVNPKYSFYPVTSASFQNLVITVTSSTAATITANNNPWTNTGSLSLTLGTGTAGANGLDTGTVAVGTWYYLYVCYGASGTCCLMSASATSPTLPGGYNISYARVGAIHTIPNEYVFTITSASAGAGATYTNNGQTFTATSSISSATTLTTYGTGAPAASGTLTYASGNPSGNITFSAVTAYTTPALFGTIQRGRKVQYVVGGPNIVTLPAMIAGSLGSTTTPTWIVQSVSTFVPPTAASILVVLHLDSGGPVMVAPNANYGGYNSITNPPFGTDSAYETIQGELILESSNIYYASGAAGNGLFCGGWTDSP